MMFPVSLAAIISFQKNEVMDTMHDGQIHPSDVVFW